MSSRQSRSRLLAVLLLGTLVTMIRASEAQEFFDPIEPPGYTAHPAQLLRAQLQNAARPAQPLYHAVQQIINRIRTQMDLVKQSNVASQKQQYQAMIQHLEDEIRNILQGPEMTTGLGLVHEHKAVIERSIRNIVG